MVIFGNVHAFGAWTDAPRSGSDPWILQLPAVSSSCSSRASVGAGGSSSCGQEPGEQRLQPLTKPIHAGTCSCWSLTSVNNCHNHQHRSWNSILIILILERILQCVEFFPSVLSLASFLRHGLSRELRNLPHVESTPNTWTPAPCWTHEGRETAGTEDGSHLGFQWFSHAKCPARRGAPTTTPADSALWFLGKSLQKTQPRRRDNRNVLGQLHARAQGKRFQRNHD